MNKNILAIGITILFIITSLTPLVIGYKVETADSELDRMLDNLRFICTDANGFSEERYEYYKEKLLRDNSNNDIGIEPEKEESKKLVEPPLNPTSIGPMDSAWPMKCHDTRHTSQSPYSTDNNPGIEKWRFYLGNWVEESAVIGNDGTIYFGCFDYYLHALNPDGTEKWRYKTGGWIWSAPSISEDGTIYVGSMDDYLYAINPDGTFKWMFYAQDSIYSSPAIAEDGTIYFGITGPGNSGRIFAVNPNGTEKWHYDTGYWIYSDPAIGDDGTVYIGSCDSYLYAMNPNGTLKWRFKTGNWVKAHPSIATDGTIYFDSFDGYLYALSQNGTVKWKRGAGSGCSSVAIGGDGTLYFGGTNFYAFYPNNGTTKWQFGLGNRRISHASPAISADGTIYIGVKIGNMEGGEIIAVNFNGTERWRKKIAGHLGMWVESSPSIGEDGTVYIGSSCDYRGYLHAFGNVESNSPPDAPSISGPTNGEAGEDYWYTFVAHDPDNNPIQLFVDWGDGDSGWVDWFASGETMWAEHGWSEQGTYTIKVMVKDVMGEESPWSELVVTMPRNKATNNMLLLKLLERYPLLEQLLNLL